MIESNGSRFVALALTLNVKKKERIQGKGGKGAVLRGSPFPAAAEARPKTTTTHQI